MEWLLMGEYGLYVWTVFGVGLLICLGLGLDPILRHKRLIKTIRNRLQKAR